MADQQALCFVNTYNNKINFCMPQREPVEIHLHDYAKAKGFKSHSWSDIYTNLLAEGWEPFAACGEHWPNVVFRCKITTQSMSTKMALQTQN